MAIATLIDSQNRFSELLEHHKGIVGKVAGTYCWHPDDRDGLSQEIVTQLWRAFPNYDESQVADADNDPAEDERIAFLKAFIEDLDPLNRAMRQQRSAV